jgi:hypothetical protein
MNNTMNKIKYKITTSDKPDAETFNVVEIGDVTWIRWKTNLGIPLDLSYDTRDVINNLRQGKWKKVSSKRQKVLKSPNLFSLDDL